MDMRRATTQGGYARREASSCERARKIAYLRLSGNGQGRDGHLVHDLEERQPTVSLKVMEELAVEVRVCSIVF